MRNIYIYIYIKLFTYLVYTKGCALKRKLGVLAALAVGFVGLASQASALNMQNEATLTIHKHEKLSDNGKTPGNGGTTQVTGRGIKGVVFSVEKVEGVDLTTNEGWVKANEIVKNSPDASQLKSGYSFAKATEGTTKDDGIVQFPRQALGLYRVTEKQSPADVQKAAPFWVTLPMLNPTTPNTFLYDVHVYPKNTIHTIEKAVVDAPTYAKGYTGTWTITTPTTTQRPTKLQITDQLDNRLVYKSAKVMIGTHVLAETADYTLTHDRGNVVMTLTEGGITKYVGYAESEPLSKLALVITAEVNGSGEIPNNAELLVNDGDVRVESNRVVSKFGAIKLHKTDEATGAALDGVKFELYAGATDRFADARKITVKGQSEFVTADGGNLTIDGLRYSNWADNASVGTSDPKYLHYWLVETQALDGYNPLAAPIHFIVDSPVASAQTLDVKNTKPVPLPLTGSVGILVLVLSGCAIALGAGVWYAKRSVNA